MRVPDVLQRAGRLLHGLVPGGLPKGVHRVVQRAGVLGNPLLADERDGQAVFVVRVVVTVPALDAEPAVVDRAFPAGDADDPVVLDVIGDRATDAAIGTNRVHRPGGLRPLRHQRFLGQGPGRTGRGAFAARHARGRSHGQVEIESDLGEEPFPASADDVVRLEVGAGADAAVAQDAGAVVDVDHLGGNVAAVRPGPRREPRLRHAQALGQDFELAVAGLAVSFARRRVIRHEELDEHPPGVFHPI